VAGDGRHAFERVTAGAYDVVVTDHQMPNMNGLDATRQIRLLPRHNQTPILAMTANAFVEDKEKCLEAGMDDFIAKPVNPEVLFATLFNNLEQSGAAQG
jgi:CheY-like chemotaxis protein